jgi:two-component system chemotaxis response regulator CheY
MLSNMLKSHYVVLGAQTGMEALDMYRKDAPDFVFLDIDLPDTNGHKVLAGLIGIDPHAFVVMLSANSQMDNVRKAVAEGAKGFVAKPFNKSKIEGYIQICLAEREQARRRQHGSTTPPQDSKHG